MSFRNPRPPRRKSPRRKSARHQSSFLASLGKITIPAALAGMFGALLLSWDAPADGLLAPLQNLLNRIINAEAPFDTGIAPPFESADAPAESHDGPALDQVDIRCRNPRVVDGDTLRCGNTRIRLAGIDTPEMAGHCREGRACTPGDPVAAKNNLQRLVNRGELQCQQSDTDHYGRAIARCVVAKVDLSCEQMRSGHAVARYGRISC